MQAGAAGRKLALAEQKLRLGWQARARPPALPRRAVARWARGAADGAGGGRAQRLEPKLDAAVRGQLTAGDRSLDTVPPLPPVPFHAHRCDAELTPPPLSYGFPYCTPHYSLL
jgi:hypothetical protein